MCAQEAVYICLGMHKCQASRDFIYVNTSPPQKRTWLLKSQDALQKLAKIDPDLTDIYHDGIIQHYANKQKNDGLCLPDFATWYNEIKTNLEQQDNHFKKQLN